MKNENIETSNNEAWLKLCNYIRTEIFQYDNNLKTPRYLYLRLRGLANGNFMSLKYENPMANYSYETILITFKICKFEIISRLKFANDEKHKVNIAMMIVEKEINNVVLKLKHAKLAENKTSSVKLDNIINEGAEYNSKIKTINNKLKDLW